MGRDAPSSRSGSGRRFQGLAASAASLGCAVLLAACASGCRPHRPGQPPADPDLPNLVLVSVDTLNRNALRAFDPQAQELPNLDRFAEGAVRFPQAFSSASWTLPAHASLLTGLYPNRHGAIHRHVMMSPEVVTLAERLREAGYYSTAFTHGGYVSRRYGLAQGFDRYDRWIDPGSRVEVEFPDVSDSGDGLIGRAIGFLQSLPDPRPPFFLFVHTYNVHDYFRRAGSEDRVEHFRECIQGRESCSEEEWIELEELYEAEIRRFDRAFGRFLEALEAATRRPTFVALLSDHGEGFDPERGRIHHGGRLHDDLIRVPFLLAGPGLDPESFERPVSLVDVGPTLLRLTGLDSPENLDGRAAFTGAPSDDGDPRVLVAMEHSLHWRAGQRLELAAPRPRPLAFAVVAGAHRFIRSVDSEELYFVEADPAQETNLLPGRENLARRLTSAAHPLLKRVLELESVEEDAELESQLRALGYL